MVIEYINPIQKLETKSDGLGVNAMSASDLQGAAMFVCPGQKNFSEINGLGNQQIQAIYED